MLINQQKDLTSLCEQLCTAAQGSDAPLAFDTEFISERRYVPQLCLVQVYCEASWGAVEALIDPLAVDLSPLLDILADAAITKIVHAGGQDLQILFQQFACPVQNVFDTQIAAAFLGFGHQIGYVDLVRRLLKGPPVSKEQQFTNWAARPLSEAQMEYALVDVRHLPHLYAALRNQLAARGRVAWAETEFRRAEAKAREVTSAEELYKKFNLSGLSRRQLAVLREAAAARETLARSLNKPPGSIVPDATLLQLAKHPPEEASALRSLRGMPSIPHAQAREIFAALQRGAQMPQDQLPDHNSTGRPDPRVDTIVGLLNQVAQLRAGEQDISRTYLAPRDQLFALASWWLHNRDSSPPDLPLLHDWRRELLGNELLELLRGRLALKLDVATPENTSPGAAEAPVVRVIHLEENE